MSPSPVREALALLLGERVLEASHRSGFSLPRLMPFELAEEYRLLGMIADGLVGLEATAASWPVEPATRPQIEALIWSLAYSTGVMSAMPVISASTLRIANYLRAESALLEDCEGEAIGLVRLIADGRRAPLRCAMRQAFRRRIAAAEGICRAAEATPKSFEKSFE